tara:strand:- start:55 stop:549 length:495 start_codon:yes stop_codon:yes gene_type:complete
MILMGIDPGNNGGICIIKNTGNYLPEIIFSLRMPVVNIYGKKIIDTLKIHSALSRFKIDVAIIEKVHAMPRQGVTSSFQFGRSFGGIEALCYIFARRVDYVAPAVWKKAIGVGSSKKDSLDMARLKFGNLENHDMWNVKSNDGIAEASLLTLYWLGKFQNKNEK